ncbi:thiosulfate oxidation carrier complex protein SoxZ [Thiotrichales bacterium HSG1]|nr:thiosulfate oxidation carrier complex protein SoxZ [Thiotrichales bacterium HSG1]
MASFRVKAKLKDGITEVKAMIPHPMESGLRKDLETGALVPAHFIKEIECTVEGKVVMSAVWSGAISKNPYWAFRIKGASKGNNLKITWKDNQGGTDSKEVKIK